MTDTPVSLLGFEYQALIEDVSVSGVPRKRSVGFQSTIPKDATQQEIDALLDKCRVAVTRQRHFSEIEALECDLRNLEGGLELSQKDLMDEDKRYAARAEHHGGRAERGLSTAEQKVRQDKIASLNSRIATRDTIKDRLRLLRAAVADCQAVEPAGQPHSQNGEQSRWDDNGGQMGAFPFSV